MMSSGDEDLVFADTFDHRSDAFPQGEKCDVIQFSYPVCVARVSVVPSGETVVYHPHQLSGLTTPSHFKLEVFCHDLKTAQSSTRFNKLCEVNFDNAFHNHTTVVNKPNCVTDLLVIKGKYDVISLCVFASVSPFSLPSPTPPVPINEKVPHLSGESTVASTPSEENVPITPAALQLPTSLMNLNANSRVSTLKNKEMFPAKEIIAGDQSQYLPPPNDVTMPPPSMGDSSLFNPQLPDAIPFAPPMKTTTTPIELMATPNTGAGSNNSVDNLHKATGATNEFETNNIAKELVDMRRDKSSLRVDMDSSRDEGGPKSASTSGSNSGEKDADNDKWLAAANLFLQQAAESAAANRTGTGTQSSSSPSSSQQKFQELLSMAEKISPQGMPRQSSEQKSSPSTDVPPPVTDLPPPPHSAAESLIPPHVPFSPHQLPGAPPGPPNPGLPPNLPPGMNLNPAAAMAVLASARFPFPAPPFNMAMPPFFNPALLEQMSKIYTGPAIMSASNMGPGMGGPPPGSMPPGLPNPQKMVVGHVPGMSGPPSSAVMQRGGPPAVSTMVSDGVGSGINVQLTSSDPMGSQSSQTDTTTSSAAEDYDDLSNDEDFEGDFEDLSDEEYEVDEEGFAATSAVPASAISAAVNIKIEAQISLEKEEDLLLETALNKHSQYLWPEQPEDNWTGDMKDHQMKHFLSPHLFISERLQDAEGITKDIDKNKMKSFLEVLTELQKRENGLGAEWVDQLESLFHLALEGLTWLKSKGFDKFRKTVKEIVAYTIMAIDWETALGQDAGDNVRQLKVGCRLTALLAHFSIESLQELLNANVFDNLFKLINQPLMLSAMQMYVLEAINALCCSSVGVKNLLASDGFARLLFILQTSRCIRINHAVSVIAHKISIFENLQTCLKQTREVIRKIRNCASVEIPCTVDSEGVAQSFVELLESLVDYPKNTLSTPGNIKKFSPQPYEDFMFRMMHEKELLEQMLTLLASPLLQPSNKLTATLFKLLDWLLSSANGRSFMFYKRETYLELIGCMKSSSELDLECEKFKSLETRMKVALKTTISVDKLKSVTATLELDGTNDTEPMGMRDCFEKIYVLTTKDCETVCGVLKQTDMLNFMSRFVANAYSKKSPEKTSNPVVESKVGKSKDNEEASSGAEQTIKTCTNVDSKHGEHPIAFFGVCILLKAAQVHDSDIENWAFPLLNLPEVEEPQAALRVSGSTSVININVQSTRMIELKRWLEPLRDLKAAIKASASKQANGSELANTEFSKVTINHIPHLVDFFKYRIEDFGPRVLAEAPGFITCIRVLMRLLKPYDANSLQPKVNLPAVVRLFEAAGYEIILKLIAKGVCENSNCYMWQSHQLMSRLPEETVESCFKLVIPLLQLLKLMIDQIASAADFHFRDMRVIKALLPLHAVMCSRFRLQNKFRSHVGQVQTLIAEIFLIYARKVTDDPDIFGAGKKEFDEENEKEEQEDPEFDEIEDADEKSGQAPGTSMGWDLMLKEVLSHIMKLPNCALSGLCLLSELLPLPLPMMSPAAMEDNELTRIRENRSNWADHLLLHKNLIQELFSHLTNSASSSLANMLRRVAWQVADLNPELAKIVICCFLDNVSELMADGNCVWQSKVSQKLQFLDHAVSQPAGKAALMEMLIEDQSLEAVDDQRVLPCFEKLLSMLEMEIPQPKNPNHDSILYYIITILQSLCDPSVSLLPFDPSETYIPTHLMSCNTPPEQMTSRICKVLLKHATGSMHSMFTFHHALKAVILLCCHDMVFTVVKKYLLSNPETLKNLLKRLHKEPKTQRNEDNLRVFISFINLLRGSNLSEDFLGSDRTIFLSTSQLLPLLSAGTADFEYSLEKYSEKLIREGVKLSGAAEDCLKGLLQYLSGNDCASEPDMSVDVNGITSSASEPKVGLLEQFEKRSVYRISPIDDDRFSPSNWFATCTDEIARDQLVTVDLSETCKESLRGFDPIVEFRKAKEAEIQRTSRKHKYQQRKYAPLMCKGMKRTGREIVRRPNYLAKEKGVELGPKRSDDVFRLRKQNTSRPPSMHVDDYMKLEKAHNDSPSALPSTVPRRKIRPNGTEPGKTSPDARKRSRLCDSPSESSQSRRPILPIVTGPNATSTPSSSRQSIEPNDKMTKSPEIFLPDNELPTGDANERGFYSAARGWINNVTTDNTRGRTGLSKTNQSAF